MNRQIENLISVHIDSFKTYNLKDMEVDMGLGYDTTGEFLKN